VSDVILTDLQLQCIQAELKKISHFKFYILERGERIEKPNSRFGSRGRGGWRGGRRNHPYQNNTQHTPESNSQLKTDIQNIITSEQEPVQSSPLEPKPATTAVKSLNEVEVLIPNK
jgi:hypothetical protein